MLKKRSWLIVIPIVLALIAAVYFFGPTVYWNVVARMGGNLSFEVTDPGTAEVNGVIGSDSLDDAQAFFGEHPKVTTLIFNNMPGSLDDETNLELARYLRTKELHIHLDSESDVNSGATDLYLSGVTRTMDCGAIYGVHSWSDGEKTAREYPRDRDHEDHKPYIDYFEDMGLDRGEDFYWFTVDVADFEEIHEMTPEEINQFGITTQPMTCDG